MNKEKLPVSYVIKAICLNCNNVDELRIPYGVKVDGEHGIYLYNDNSGYYNLDTNKYQSTAFYPKCSKCGTTSLKKVLHIKNAIELLEQKIDSAYEQLREIKRSL